MCNSSTIKIFNLWRSFIYKIQFLQVVQEGWYWCNWYWRLTMLIRLGFFLSVPTLASVCCLWVVNFLVGYFGSFPFCSPFPFVCIFCGFFFCLIFFFFNINQCLHEKVQMTSGLSVLNSPFPASCTALPFSQGILADAMLGSPGCLWGQRSLFGAEPAGHSYSCHPRAAGASGFKLCKITTVPFWSWNLAQNRHVRGTEGEQPVLKRVCVFREYW